LPRTFPLLAAYFAARGARPATQKIASSGAERDQSVVVMIPLCVIGRKSASGVVMPVLNPRP